ncbi:hypothetical protein [Bacilliculturomica massiliensis]|uniref:hypothetical protein n=1 Tax=Bacilliculturomica massiliensis TaxID=1917867 RepID=UPI00102FB67C|nr:hypothetical protein [Bacilliculturomica massiliensis]
MSETILNSLAQRYVDLTLCKTKYDPWDVYWYADKPFWRRESMNFSREYKIYPYVDLGEKKEGRTLKNILDESVHLQESLELYRKSAAEAELDRVNYLIDHTINLQTRTRVLLGETMSYDAMTEGCYSLRAPDCDYAVFDAMKQELDAALPGKGPVAERVMNFENRITIPRDRVPAVLTAATHVFHDCAVKNMDISSGNMPRLRFRDLGGEMEFLSILFGYEYDHIEMERNFALDYPFTVDKVVEMIGHEMEPGHLTYFELRLKTMIDTCFPEMQIIAQYSPSSAFCEGSARMAVYMCFDHSIEQLVDFEREVIFEQGRLDKSLAACMPLWHRFRDLAGYGKLEATRNRWNGVWDKEEAGAFLEKYLFAAPGSGAQTVDRLAADDGHFVSHDYARDVMRDYYKAMTKNTDEQWRLYQKLCRSHMSMRGIRDLTYRIDF